jgi:hypothetical protein
MEPTGGYDDPLRQLESWGRQVDRRARRATAGRRLLAPFRALAALGRLLRRRGVIVVVGVCAVAVAFSYGIGLLADR